MVYCDNLPSKYNEAVETVSDNIDYVTHYRIDGIGWDNLTQHQKRNISRACEKYAIWYFDNKDAMNNPVDTITLGSITMSSKKFDSDAYYREDGIIMPRDVYALLLKTGLCCNVID